MKKLLGALVLATVCGSAASAISIEQSREIVLNGDVLASEITNAGGYKDEVFASLIIRHEGEIYKCIVNSLAVMCFDFGKYH